MLWCVLDDVIVWVNWVIVKNFGILVILICYQFVGIGLDVVMVVDMVYLNYLWDKLIKNNDQIFMVVFGYYYGLCKMMKKNVVGNDVIFMVVDYQMVYMGGNGLMCLYEFDLMNNRIIVSLFLLWVLVKLEVSLNQFDLVWLMVDNQNFLIDIDFVKCFVGFNFVFKVVVGLVLGSLMDVVKGLIFVNYYNLLQDVGKLVFGLSDYFVVFNMLVYWCFYNMFVVEGEVLFLYQLGFQIKDVFLFGDVMVGVNFILFNMWMGGQFGDLVWLKDYYLLFFVLGSLQFKNVIQMRFLYFMIDLILLLNV